MMRNLTLPDATATESLGAALAKHAVPGDVILLHGDLGAGKTTLARGFIQSVLGSKQEVTSPTFNLVHCYDHATQPIWHFDLYRLTKPEDLRELGLDDALQSAISLIEWPNLALPLLPKDRLELTLKPENGHRVAILSASGTWESKLGTAI
jgi:tRNA threonylcarbamoyladenosine biosynthesis protein TsaE